MTCFCCGSDTIGARGEYEICPVCFWEDEDYLGAYEMREDALLNIPSYANHGLTLAKGRQNYLKFGACDKSMIKNVRPPKDDERQDKPIAKKL